MKNITKLMTVIILVCCNVNIKAQVSGPHHIDGINQNIEIIDQTIVFRWWETALIDGAGALGGAASVATFINLASATPWGWAAIGGGALVGGAGASIGAGGGCGRVENENIAHNPNNTHDNIGHNHNEIIIEFTKNSTNPDIKLYDFIYENYVPKEVEEKIKVEVFYEIVQQVSNFKNRNDILDYIVVNLPKPINSTSFRDKIVHIGENYSEVFELINAIKLFENDFNRTYKLSDKDQFVMDAFFSTLRYSVVLWYAQK